MHLRQFISRISASGSDSFRSSTGVVLKSSATHLVGLVFLCSVVSSSLLSQVPGPNQASHGFPAAAAVASSTRPQAPSGSQPHDQTFIIGNDDVLAINVWKEADLSRSTQVRSDGKISLPLIGEVQAAGRTPLQLEQDITTRLLNYITKPEVTIIVEQINSEKFNVLGQVVKPGSYSLALAPTVVDAIAIAGGTRDFAKQKSIYILRQNPGGGESRIAFNYKDFIKGNPLQQNVKLQPHDTVVVP
jgi:polysaccharide export outer membrane protein